MTERHFDPSPLKKNEFLLLYMHISISFNNSQEPLAPNVLFSVGVKTRQFIFDVYLLMVNSKHFLL